MSAELAAELERARWDMAALEREQWPSRPPPRRTPVAWAAPLPVTAERARRNRVALLEAFVGVPLDEPEPATPAAAERRRSA